MDLFYLLRLLLLMALFYLLRLLLLMALFYLLRLLLLMDFIVLVCVVYVETPKSFIFLFWPLSLANDGNLQTN